MIVSYSKLWKLLIDKKITKQGLRRITKISPSMISKMEVLPLIFCCEYVICLTVTSRIL